MFVPFVLKLHEYQWTLLKTSCVQNPVFQTESKKFNKYNIKFI